MTIHTVSMSLPKLDTIVLTFGVAVLGLSLMNWFRIKLAYESTSTSPVDFNQSQAFTYATCVKAGMHPKCCKAAQKGGITDEEFNNCHLCNHPDCSHLQTTGPAIDPTIPPFQPGTYKIALQDIGFKSNYVYA